nr:hypothetical protein [Clostridiales bacterium]
MRKAPLNKYYKLYSELLDLLEYGSKFVSEESEPSTNPKEKIETFKENEKTNSKSQVSFETLGFFWKVLIFAFPILGPVFILINLKRHPQKAKSALFPMLAGIVLIILFFVYVMLAAEGIVDFII